MTYNKYHLQLYNIHTIINHYGFKYRWLDVSKEKFLNYTHVSYKYLLPQDKYLQDVKEDRSKMGEDILQRGMFFPFFYCIKDNQNYLFMGKHRLHSLLLYHKQCKFNKKFLFIEYYSDPWEKKENSDEIPDDFPKLFTWRDGKFYKVRPKTYCDLNWMLVDNGDSLSNWLYDNNIQPSPIVNDEKLFEEFINKPFNLPLKMEEKGE